MSIVMLVIATLTLWVSDAQGLEQKIGYVDLNAALNQVEEGKAAKAKLKADFAGKQKQLDDLQAAFKKKKEAFESQQTMMKPTVKEAKQAELQNEVMQLQQTYVKLQQELMERETSITQDIGDKLRKVIERIGDRDGYTMILNIGETVLYHKRHRDITDLVVAEYNALYGKK